MGAGGSRPADVAPARAAPRSQAPVLPVSRWLHAGPARGGEDAMPRVGATSATERWTTAAVLRGGGGDAVPRVRAAAATERWTTAAVPRGGPLTGTLSGCLVAAPRTIGAAAALALLAAACCGFLVAGGALPWRGRAAAREAQRRQERAGHAPAGRQTPPSADPCGGPEEDVDIWTWARLAELPSVTSWRACRGECSADARCAAWTWGRERGADGLTDVCFLKGLKAGVAPQRRPTPGVVSGLLCGGPGGGGSAGPSGEARGEVAALSDQGSAVRPSAPPPGGGGGDSLFCFAVMLPEGYERGLVKMQHRRNISLFACDGWSVYSSREVKVAPGLITKKVHSNLTCGYGGEFHTALNLEIFMVVWVKVISDGAWRNFGWTTKVDPDSVFFPDRLRVVVRHHMEEAASPRGVYLNNCQFGLHGPLEVFSRNAVETWAKGSAHCVKHFADVCAGDCLWGEDMFVDQCLWKVLNVSREDDDALLVEDHCDPPAGWESCDNSSFVAYHPFKESSSYEACWGNSQGSEARAVHA